MRRFILLLFVIALLPNIAQAQVLPDQVRVSYAALNKPLGLVIEELSAKSGVQIVFSSNRIPTQRKISGNYTNETLGTILTVILDRYRLTYEIVGDQIVIIRDRRLRPRKAPTISGYIKDKATGETLIGANVFMTDMSAGTVTNNHGFYSFKLPSSGTYRLLFSYVGYEVDRKEIYFRKDTIMDIELDPQAILNEVLISDDRSHPVQKTSYTEEVINADELNSIPGVGGEGDISRIIGFMPGVSSGPDGIGGINVRGGSADQNLVLLDDVPIYNPNHALGLFSVFNSNIVKNAKFLKGNFPSRYGGRLSSVMDIRTKDGNSKSLAGEISLSTVASKLYLEGPIINENTFVISIRRTFLDPWIKEVTKYLNEQNENEGFANYYFYDTNAKLNFKLGRSSQLTLSGYLGSDNFNNNILSSTQRDSITYENVDRVNWEWGNKMLSMKLRNQFGTKAYGNLTAYYTKYNFSAYEYDRYKTERSSNVEFNYLADLFTSEIEDIGIKYDFDYILNNKNWIKIGGGVINHAFTPGLKQISEKDEIIKTDEDPTKEEVESLLEEPEIEGREIFAYVEDEFNAGAGVFFNVGSHASYIITGEDKYLNIQPRISFIAQSDVLFYKMGISKMVQYLHLLSSNGLGLPNEVWLPSSKNLAPGESWNYNAEFGSSFGNGITISLGGFYKTYDKIISYNEGGTVSITQDLDWESNVPVGNGKVYGLEFTFNKRAGRSTWFSSYTYSQSKRHFVDLNNDLEFPFKYDRRHNIKLAFVHRITENAEFALNWNMSSGNPFTSPEAIIATPDPTGGVDLSFLYTEKNNELLPDYQRLDVAFSFYSDFGWGKQKISLGLYNMLNKRNPYYIDIVRDVNRDSGFVKEQFSVLPIFPSLSYSLSF